MNVLPPILLLSFISLLVGAAPSTASANGPAPVVVELFTSEGCSDCPPADDLLNAMAGRTDVIPLAFHVTYWDNATWRDRFSDIRYTRRQVDYVRDFHIPSAYTPQAVIDGRFEVVGNSPAAVNGAIGRARSDAKPVAVELSAGGGSLRIGAHAFNPAIGGRVFVAITEDGLTTAVKGGENQSRTLHHSAVVRSLEDEGALSHGAFSRTVALNLDRAWQRGALHAVVLVQDAAGRVIGAATVPLTRQAQTRTGAR